MTSESSEAVIARAAQRVPAAVRASHELAVEAHTTSLLADPSMDLEQLIQVCFALHRPFYAPHDIPY